VVSASICLGQKKKNKGDPKAKNGLNENLCSGGIRNQFQYQFVCLYHRKLSEGVMKLFGL